MPLVMARAESRSAVLGRCGRPSGRCGEGRIPPGAEGQGEAGAAAPDMGARPGAWRAPRGCDSQPSGARPARPRGKLERAVRPQTEPALGQLAPGQTPYEQSALAHGGVQGPAARRRGGPPVPRAGEHGLEPRQSLPSSALGEVSSTKRTSHMSRAETAAEQRLRSLSLSPSKLSAPPRNWCLKRSPPVRPAGAAGQSCPPGVSKNMRRPAGPPSGESGPRYRLMPSGAGRGQAARGQHEVIDPVRHGVAAGIGGVRAGSAQLPAGGQEPAAVFRVSRRRGAGASPRLWAGAPPAGSGARSWPGPP